MSYFKNFPLVKYKFGNEVDPVIFTRLSTYAGAIDVFKKNAAAYTKIEIQDGERPDTLSYKLYGKSDYYWTFFMMNDALREGGWPLTQQRVYEYAQQEAYSNFAVQLDGTYTDYTSGATTIEVGKLFPVGQSVEINGATTATVLRKNPDLAQVFLQFVSGSISDMTAITSITTVPTATGDIFSAAAGTSFYNSTNEYLSPYYYTSGGERTDIDSFNISGITAIPVTHQQFLVAENDKLRSIRIVKKSAIEQVVSEFSRVLKSR